MTVTPERAAELASMPYADYLQTPEWKARSAAAKQRAGHRCQVCNSPSRLQAHHRTYERRGREEDGDLTVLCDGCHERHHHAGSPDAVPVLPAAPSVVRPAAWQSPPARPAPLLGRRPARRRRVRRALRAALAPSRIVTTAAGALIFVGAVLLVLSAGVGILRG